jgi:hypothetical protein
VTVHYLRDLIRDGHVKLVKFAAFAGTQNVSDALTKTLDRHAFEKHREYVGFPVCVPFSAFFTAVESKIAPVMAYSIQLPKLISSSHCDFSRQMRCRWLKLSFIRGQSAHKESTRRVI